MIKRWMTIVILVSTACGPKKQDGPAKDEASPSTHRRSGADALAEADLSFRHHVRCGARQQAPWDDRSGGPFQAAAPELHADKHGYEIRHRGE
jgi:hypothetical protein